MSDAFFSAWPLPTGIQSLIPTALSAGDKLGPYEILAQIGAGGMGEVYRARDGRVSRDVAIKVSAERFSDRFEIETRAIAALNHPNICQLYDVGRDYLVMELIEGEALKGPVPLDTAVHYAGQIADALAAAHERGIVHRDLKPANIRVKEDGTVKVLDFGLAKSAERQAATAGDENSPTMPVPLTQAGMIVGTAAYMSPEQARGKPVDHRADIWAFGVVLYEMVTGERAFRGDSAAELIGAVIHKEPDLVLAPAKVRRLIEKCLEKDPRHRLQAIGDWKLLLDEPGAAAAVTAPPRSRLVAMFWPTVAALLAALGMTLWAPWRAAPEPRTVTRQAMSVPAEALLPILSRDGTRLAYTQVSRGTAQIRLRMMDQLEANPIPGAESGAALGFSPDGQWIVYQAGSPPKLKKIPVTGGTAVTICDLRGSGSATWAPDDTVIFGDSTGLMRVPAAGGTPQLLLAADGKSGESFNFPQLLPDGTSVLFAIFKGTSLDSARVAVLDLKTRTHRVLVNSAGGARYTPSGHLVFGRGSTLFAAPFDLKRLAVTGPEVPVVEGVGQGYSFSDSSLMVFLSGRSRISGPTAPSKLEWIDRQGNSQPLTEAPQRWSQIAIAPNGRLVAGTILEFGSGPSRLDIWLYDLERRTLTRLTFDGHSQTPAWTPDSRWVTYESHGADGTKDGIYRVPADKSGPPELLVAPDQGFAFAHPGSWAPDGRTLVYGQGGAGRKYSIWILPAPGSTRETKPRLFSRSSFNETGPVLSPDGKWIAYSSDESGKYEVVVEPFPGPGAKLQVSTHGGWIAGWARNGRELYYVDPDTREMMVVETQTGPAFHAGQPKAMFKMPDSSIPSINAVIFDVSPDQEAAKADSTLIVTTNWFDDLRKRVPVSR
jgi:serine/threonine-protein kinase